MARSDGEPPEPRDNYGYVCDLHTPKPNPWLALIPPERFVGHYVKRAFPVRASTNHEHMWVYVEGVNAAGALVGRLDNDPVLDCGLTCGDRVVVDVRQIEAVVP